MCPILSWDLLSHSVFPLLMAALGFYISMKAIENKNEKYFVYVLFLILTGLAVYSNYKVDCDNSQKITKEEKMRSEALEKADKLQQSVDKLNLQMEPFLKLAIASYPSLPIPEALEKLKNDLVELQHRTSTLEQETQKTEFYVSNTSRKQLADGTYETQLTLIPDGQNVVPILMIICQTENGAQIKNFKAKGPTVPPMSFDGTSQDKTAWRKEFHGMYPGNVDITIITDKDPGHIKFQIDPLRKNQNSK